MFMDVFTRNLLFTNAVNLNCFFLPKPMGKFKQCQFSISVLPRRQNEYITKILGCDSTSAFFGKGKKTPLTVAKAQDYLESCAKIGQSIPPVENLSEEIQKYVCALYGQKDVCKVNIARYNLFKLGKFSEDNIPPNDDTLHQHLLRANFQAYIWKHSLSNVLNIPSPCESGWTLEDDELVIRWMRKPCAQDGFLENVTCGCKTGCQSRRCFCLRANIKCTEVCQCSNCSNPAEEHKDGEISSSEESDDELLD